ncbi:MAG: NAD(P)H-dependent oxidoreductase subunit E, partial [Chloroflexi bacterium]|nr:NAD(P)H-dependent oxidoreductase subunit E [Chloroflexota bacterium]
MAQDIQVIVDNYNGDEEQLVSILQDVQIEYHYLPKEALEEVSRVLGIPLSQVYGVATFYRAFSLTPRGRHVAKVCLGTACHVRGAVRVLERMELDL